MWSPLTSHHLVSQNSEAFQMGGREWSGLAVRYGMVGCGNYLVDTLIVPN